MTSKAKLVDRDLGMAEFLKEVKKSDGSSVLIGIQGKEASAKKTGSDANIGGATLVEVATVHEYGYPEGNIPERSFMRSTVDENQAKYRKQILKFQNLIVDRKITAKRSLGLLGLVVVSDIQKRIRSRIEPKLEDSTLKSKTRKDGKVADVPLILTGQMLQSIRSFFEDKSGRRDEVGKGVTK